MASSSSSVLLLYDLAGSEDNRRTSPYCWRIRFALAYKQVQYHSIPWRRVEKDVLQFTGQGKVPVLVDGQQPVFDSWQIARYLDKKTGNTLLLGGERETYAVKFIVTWVNEVILTAMRDIISHGAIEVSASKDQAFYTDKLRSRGVQLETVGGSKANLMALHKALQPLRLTLEDQQYLGGVEPNFADFALAGAFAWARSVSPIILLEESDPVFTWRRCVFSMFQQDFKSTVGYSYE